jgi:hypothetical protein
VAVGGQQDQTGRVSDASKKKRATPSILPQTPIIPRNATRVATAAAATRQVDTDGDTDDEAANADPDITTLNAFGLPTNDRGDDDVPDSDVEVDDDDSINWQQLDPHAPRASRSSPGGNTTEVPVFETRGHPNPGPINVPPDKCTPLNIWELFFDDYLCEMFVRQSNAYAARTNIPHYIVADIPFLKLFFALILYMGVVVVPDRRRAFSQSGIFGQSFLFNTMSAKRFEN